MKSPDHSSAAAAARPPSALAAASRAARWPRPPYGRFLQPRQSRTAVSGASSRRDRSLAGGDPGCHRITRSALRTITAQHSRRSFARSRRKLSTRDGRVDTAAVSTHTRLRSSRRRTGSRTTGARPGSRVGLTGRFSPLEVLDLEPEAREAPVHRAVELRLVLLGRLLVQRRREVVAQLREDLRARLDEVLVLAEPLLGLVALGAVVRCLAPRRTRGSAPRSPARRGRAAARSRP